MEIAKTILAQLGGNRFIAMTGSKDFVSDGNTLHITTLTAEATAWLAEALGDDAIHASRLPEGNGKGKKGGSKSKNRSIKYVCPECGTIIRATREVNVICGDCGVSFMRE